MIPAFIIINADDLGYSHHRDAAIFDLFECGKISGASLIVNGPSAEDAVKRALKVGLPMGLHINLTEGIPLTPCNALKTRGRMPYKNKFRELARQNSNGVREAVKAEVKAQLKKFEEMTGKPARHVDGHQHVHVAPNMPALLSDLLKASGVKSVRIPEEWVQDYEWLSAEMLVHYYTRYVDAVGSRVVYGRAGFKMNDHTVAMAMSGKSLTAGRLCQCLAGKSGVIEVLAHPGTPPINSTPDKEFCDPFDVDIGRVHEWNVFKDFDVGVALRTWSDVASG